MALSYGSEGHLQTLLPVLDDYAEWYTSVVRAIMYPESNSEQDRPVLPHSFIAWLEEVRGNSEAVEKDVFYSLRKIHTEMVQAAEGLLGKAVPGAPLPTRSSFDQFTNLYESFVTHIRRLEHDMAQIDSGMDTLTGLRTEAVMMSDLEREMERLARHGKPFCLALARVDHLERINKLVDKARKDEITQTLATLIKRCMRTFDDAYRLADGEFIMSLKQTETKGGAAAVERLRKFIEQEKIVIKEGDYEYQLTMSYCVAAPVPGDLPETVIANMRGDLDRYKSDGNMSLEYLEQSPLQRYIKGSD
ncbi:MAG: diguanylate cyclase [Rhodospirillales bacterium]|nr:diguanylate cyclase [Rhodospirillales bacterium]